MDILPLFTCMSLQTSFSLSVPSVAQNEHVFSFRRILVTVLMLVDYLKRYTLQGIDREALFWSLCFLIPNGPLGKR